MVIGYLYAAAYCAYVPCRFTRRAPKVVLGNFNGPLAFWFVCVWTRLVVVSSVVSSFPDGNPFGIADFLVCILLGAGVEKTQEGTHPTGQKLGNVAFKGEGDNSNNEQ